MMIGVLDSGIGGIKVLEDLIKSFGGKYLYVFDKSGLPYGKKSYEQICERVIRACDVMIKSGVDVIVLACNTASCVALDVCRNYYNIPVYGLIPPIKNLCVSDKKILMLTTPLTCRTIKSKYEKEYYSGAFVWAPQIDLAEFVEHNIADRCALDNYIEEHLTCYKTECDSVFLGCTHYYYIKESIEKILKKPVIDGRSDLVNEIKSDDVLRVNKYSETHFIYL